MTSPSWPVSVSPPEPLPGIAFASTKRTSPPAPVTARPVATPGTAVRAADSWKTFWRPRASRIEVEVDRDRRLDRAARDARRRLAQQRPELALEVAHARLAGVLADDRAQHVVADRHLVGAQAVALELALPQVVAADGDLLLDGVAVEADDLHAVEQRAGDRLRLVGGRDEHDLAEVDLQVEVVVAEASSSAPGRAPRAGRSRDRRASRRRPCRPRRAGSPGSSSPRRAARGPAGPEARRCTCGGDRGSRPRRARRRATCARTRGPSRGRSTRRSRSCRCREGRSASGSLRPVRRRERASRRRRPRPCGAPCAAS